MELNVQTTGLASFGAEPGTYFVTAVLPTATYGSFTVGASGITATTGALVASTPTSLTVDPTQLAQVRIPLSQHADPPNQFLFTGRLNVPIHIPPMFGGPFSGGDVRFSFPDGHYVVSNGQFGLPPFNWGSFDVANHQLVSASDGFLISNGQLAVDRCAFAASERHGAELYVRAEKNKHQGHAPRVYTIECSASDTSATTTTTATVTVPHDNSGH